MADGKKGFMEYGMQCAKDVTTPEEKTIQNTEGEALKYVKLGKIMSSSDFGLYATATGQMLNLVNAQ